MEKTLANFVSQVLIQVMLSETLPDSSTLIDGVEEESW